MYLKNRIGISVGGVDIRDMRITGCIFRNHYGPLGSAITVFAEPDADVAFYRIYSTDFLANKADLIDGLFIPEDYVASGCRTSYLHFDGCLYKAQLGHSVFIAYLYDSMQAEQSSSLVSVSPSKMLAPIVVSSRCKILSEP